MFRAKQIYKNYLSSPLIAVAIVLFILAAITFKSSSNSSKVLSAKAQNTAKVLATPIIPKEITPTSAVSSGNSYQQEVVYPTIYLSPTTTTTTTTTSSTSNSNGNNSQNQNFQVSLSINGSNVGQVSVSPGQNQCDVLNDAQAQGKISGLDMRYDSTLGTYGVYKINGVGKDNSVWWTYKVNGSEPDKGCSYVGASSGDAVEWDYQG